MSRALPDTTDLTDAVRKRAGNREAQTQAEIVAWLREALPNCLVFAVWNGGDLISKSEASKRRWMGVIPGVADIIVAAPGRVLFLEVKAPAGVVSAEQRSFGGQAQTLGHTWAVVRSVDDVRRALEAVGIEFVKFEEDGQ
jgi:hypothetical protein